MSCCLNRDELTQVMLCLVEGTTLEESGVQLIDESGTCEEEVVGLTYLLVQILVRLKRQGQEVERAISDFFDLPNKMWFSIEEFGVDFIECMLVNTRDQRLTLEDDIIEIATKMRRHQYGHTLRL